MNVFNEATPLERFEAYKSQVARELWLELAATAAPRVYTWRARMLEQERLRLTSCNVHLGGLVLVTEGPLKGQLGIALAAYTYNVAVHVGTKMIVLGSASLVDACGFTGPAEEETIRDLEVSFSAHKGNYRHTDSWYL